MINFYQRIKSHLSLNAKPEMQVLNELNVWFGSGCKQTGQRSLSGHQTAWKRLKKIMLGSADDAKSDAKGQFVPSKNDFRHSQHYLA